MINVNITGLRYRAACDTYIDLIYSSSLYVRNVTRESPAGADTEGGWGDASPHQHAANFFPGAVMLCG